MKEKIRELFAETKLEQVLLINNSPEQPWLPYFTSLPLNQFQNNALILRKGRKPLLVTTFLWHGLLKGKKGLRAVKAADRKEFLSILRKALPKKRVGVNYSEYSASGLARLKRKLKGKRLVNISKDLEALRETKTKKEDAKIFRAVKITERALERVPRFFKKGMTERELALKLELEILQSGADGTSFPIIVASGKRGAIPHYITSNKKIRKGFLLIDFGARYKNYCADLSRTFYVGKAGEKEKALYAAVHNAKLEAEKKAKLGVKASALFRAADSVLKESGHKMEHSLGHGIGLQDHDFPGGISAKAKWKLEEGMCLAIEPAIYGKFGGIRLEDNYAVGKKGLKRMSKAPKKLAELR